MRRWVQAIAIAVASVLAGVVPALAQTAEVPQLRAGALRGSLTVDGRLSEADWAAAPLIEALVQVDPREAAPASAQTTVRVLASPTALAVGIVCHDADPSGIVSYSVRRDAPLDSEDHECHSSSHFAAAASFATTRVPARNSSVPRTAI